MRRRLDKRVRMYTGDDFNYAELIAGDEQGYSHALLGIFDAIAPAAAAALSALAAGDDATFHDILAPTVPLSRHIFRAPTRFYKTGVVFMAYLNGHQDHFTMVGGQESARSTLHLGRIFRLADRAGLLRDPELAAERMRIVLAVARDGVTERCGTSPTTGRIAPCRSTPRRSESRAISSPSSKPAPARHPRDLALARPGRGGRARPRRAGREGCGLELSGYCRGGMFPADGAHRDGGARRQPPRGRRGGGAGRALPRARGRRPAAIFAAGLGAVQGPRGRARRGRGRDRAAARICARRRHAARDRAAASDVCGRPRLREHARAGARHLRPARSAAHAACSASRSTSIMSGGTRS